MPAEAVEWYCQVRLSLSLLGIVVVNVDDWAWFGRCRCRCVDAMCLMWAMQNLDFNVPGGKLDRGLSIVDLVEILRGRGLTDNEYFKAVLLGWCIELVRFGLTCAATQLQAFLLVSDDMMDQSIMRRGQPCRYRIQGVGNIAINDAFMLEGVVYHLLKKHFREEPYYVHPLELFHEVRFPRGSESWYELTRGRCCLGCFRRRFRQRWVRFK